MAPMSITFATPDGQAGLLSVEPAEAVATVAAALHSILAIPPADQALSFNGAPLSPDQTFASARVADGDLILVERVVAAPATAPAAAAGATAQRNTVLDAMRTDPATLAELRQASPQLHDAVVAGDADRAMALMAELQRQLQQRGSSRALSRPGAAAAAPPARGVGAAGNDDDPMSADAQAEIAERIRMENVIRNFEDAFEHNPESFAQVVMLFVDVKVNGHPTTAFVDSGAQATIISKACAERCGILRLLDTRFSGIARGVGTATIFGRIHLALLDVAGHYFEVSFTVMEDTSYDMLLGLDMLRKHQASIDLSSNCLRIGGASTPFLPEHKIPRNMRTMGEVLAGEGHGSTREDRGSANPIPAQTEASAAPATSPLGGNAASAAEARLHRGKVDSLVNLGFSREESEQALRACNGNEEHASAMLAQAKYGF